MGYNVLPSIDISFDAWRTLCIAIAKKIFFEIPI